MALPVTRRAAELTKLGEDARDYLAASRSENTLRAYRIGWAQFEAWCRRHRVESLPAEPQTVALYVADLAGTLKPATIDARLAAISAAHRAAGHPSPTKAEEVHQMRRGVRNKVGTAQRQVRPVRVEDLRAMVGRCGDHPAGHRDRALLLLGFAGALRRSELVALDVEDVAESATGLTLLVRRSKTDQEGQGRIVGVPYGSHVETCPVRAWKEWLEVSHITTGAAFRPVDRFGRVSDDRLGDRSVALIVKRYAGAAGLDPEKVAGHSLRAGLATSAAAAGVSERVIAATTGHKGTVTLRRYIREGSLFRENAASQVGL